MSAAISTRVMRSGQARFDMVGQQLPDGLHDTDQTISPGLVSRLVRYALGTLDGAGFAVRDWPCEVYTMDGDLIRSERYYCVEFTNAKGGMIGVQGIGTLRGHPSIDHGVCIDTGRMSRQ